MERLWAPWRMKYIKTLGHSDPGCIFCAKPQQDIDRENLILFRGDTCFAILNAFPYNNGHLMVVPYLHTSMLEELRGEIAKEMWDVVSLATSVLSEAFHPDGFNVGMNLGRAAGAGIEQHAHIHVVPRWNGDTNFMGAVGETKVLSQDLGETYDSLRPYFIDLGEIS